MTAREAERAKNMFALGLMSWLYGRPTESTTSFIATKFAKRPEIAEANLKAFNDRLCVRRDVRGVRRPVRGEGREAAAGALPADHRQHGALVGAARRVEALGAAALPRRVPDHAGVVDSRGAREAQVVRRAHVSGGGRDRRRRRRARRVLRWRARRHDLRRSRRRPEVGDGRPCDHARAAAPDRRRSARGPVDRHADEARAGRPPDGALRPQRRVAGAGARGATPGRLLLRGDRGGARRDHLPHARLPAE